MDQVRFDDRETQLQTLPCTQRGHSYENIYILTMEEGVHPNLGKQYLTFTQSLE